MTLPPMLLLPSRRAFLAIGLLPPKISRELFLPPRQVLKAAWEAVCQKTACDQIEDDEDEHVLVLLVVAVPVVATKGHEGTMVVCRSASGCSCFVAWDGGAACRDVEWRRTWPWMLPADLNECCLPRTFRTLRTLRAPLRAPA